MILSCAYSRAKQALCLLLIAISSTAAWGSLSISRTSIELHDSKSRDRVRFAAELSTSQPFFITVRAPVYSNNTRPELFEMKSDLPRLSGTVTFAIDIPFHRQNKTSRGKNNNANRVKNNYRHDASGQYSLCPVPTRVSAATMVCKPLTFTIIDDSTAVPGVTYRTRLNLLIESDNGEQYIENIDVSYHKKGSPISIASRAKKLSLNSDTHFSDSVDFCVSSPAYSDFDVKVESPQSSQGNFRLTDNQGSWMPYELGIQLNNNSAMIPVTENQWISGGQTINAKNSNACRGKHNLTLNAQLSGQAIKNAKPGSYHDVLTVRVKAK